MIKSIITNLSAITLLLITCCSSSSDSPAPVKSNKLTLLTYNIHHGAPSNPDVINLSNIAAVIKKSGAEIIALQEVDVILRDPIMLTKLRHWQNYLVWNIIFRSQ